MGERIEPNVRYMQAELAGMNTKAFMNPDFVKKLEVKYPRAVVGKISIVIETNDRTNVVTLFHRNGKEESRDLLVVDGSNPDIFEDFLEILTEEGGN